MTATTPYRNFQTAVYCTVRDVLHMEDHGWRDRALAHLQRSLHVDKVYLESFRSMETASRETLLEARDFFASSPYPSPRALNRLPPVSRKSEIAPSPPPRSPERPRQDRPHRRGCRRSPWG